MTYYEMRCGECGGDRDLMVRHDPRECISHYRERVRQYDARVAELEARNAEVEAIDRGIVYEQGLVLVAKVEELRLSTLRVAELERALWSIVDGHGPASVIAREVLGDAPASVCMPLTGAELAEKHGFEPIPDHLKNPFVRPMRFELAYEDALIDEVNAMGKQVGSDENRGARTSEAPTFGPHTIDGTATLAAALISEEDARVMTAPIKLPRTKEPMAIVEDLRIANDPRPDSPKETVGDLVKRAAVLMRASKRGEVQAHVKDGNGWIELTLPEHRPAPEGPRTVTPERKHSDRTLSDAHRAGIEVGKGEERMSIVNWLRATPGECGLPWVDMAYDVAAAIERGAHMPATPTGGEGT